ncbi:MAG: SDR family oxidoreductase [Pseudomonadota bacterium]
MTSNVLITGGAGFIGSHLTESLLIKGCTVTVLDNLSTGSLLNLADARDRIRFVEGDITRLSDIETAITGCDTLVHLAATVLVPETIDDPVGSALVNEIGALNMLEAARKSGCRRIVLASSAAVYGNSQNQSKNENMVFDPQSPYAVQKLAMEHYASVYHSIYGLETVCLRFFNVYGPRQDPSSQYSGVISIFLEKACRRLAPVIFGDGLQTRDFIYVGDVVDACRSAMTASGVAGQVFNIGTGRPIAINSLWDAISIIAEVPLRPEIASERSGDIRHSVADIKRATHLLGFSPTVSLEDGLRMTLEWYKGQMKNRWWHKVAAMEL